MQARPDVSLCADLFRGPDECWRAGSCDRGRDDGLRPTGSSRSPSQVRPSTSHSLTPRCCGSARRRPGKASRSTTFARPIRSTRRISPHTTCSSRSTIRRIAGRPWPKPRSGRRWNRAPSDGSGSTTRRCSASSMASRCRPSSISSWAGSCSRATSRTSRPAWCMSKMPRIRSSTDCRQRSRSRTTSGTPTTGRPGRTCTCWPTWMRTATSRRAR